MKRLDDMEVATAVNYDDCGTLAAEATRARAEEARLTVAAEDERAIAAVLKAVPWRDDEDAHQFAANGAAAIRNYLINGGGFQ